MTAVANKLTIRIPLTVRRRDGARKVVVPGGVLPMPAKVDVTPVKALARAFRWRRMLEGGHYATVRDLAAGERINPSYASRLLRLTLLATDIVEAILDGRQPDRMTLPALTEPFPVEWARQTGCPLPSPAPPIDGPNRGRTL
jgi:hypothetical protein